MKPLYLLNRRLALQMYFFVLLSIVLSSCSGRRDVKQLPDTPAPVRQVTSVPSAPSLAVAASSKMLHFTWPALSNTTHYKLYQNADGVSGFSQLGSDLSTTQFDDEIAVHLFDWPNARFMLEACNAGGCTASSEVTAESWMLQSIGKIQHTTEVNFGNHIALSSDGNTLAVNSPTVAGVYVYTKSMGGWVQQALVKAVNPVVNAYEGFGSAVSLSADGSVLAVGASAEDGGAVNSGAAYIFVRTNNVWLQHSYIKATNADANDEFGNTIALSSDGTTLAVGAYREDSSATQINGDQLNNNAYNSGAVYVYAFNGANWIFQAYLKASVIGTELGGEQDGGNIIALASDGNTLAVGNSGSSERVYVFVRSGDVWTQQALLQPIENSYFGRSITLSADGNILGIGAQSGKAGDTVTGAAYVFVRSGNNWLQQAYLQASNIELNDNFGRTVVISADGNTLAVTSMFEDSAAIGINGDQNDNTAVDSGAVFVFKRVGNSWEQRAYVKASEVMAANAYFGRIGLGISADGNVLAAATFPYRTVYLF